MRPRVRELAGGLRRHRDRGDQADVVAEEDPARILEVARGRRPGGRVVCRQRLVDAVNPSYELVPQARQRIEQPRSEAVDRGSGIGDVERFGVERVERQRCGEVDDELGQRGARDVDDLPERRLLGDELVAPVVELVPIGRRVRRRGRRERGANHGLRASQSSEALVLIQYRRVEVVLGEERVEAIEPLGPTDEPVRQPSRQLGVVLRAPDGREAGRRLRHPVASDGVERGDELLDPLVDRRRRRDRRRRSVEPGNDDVLEMIAPVGDTGAVQRDGRRTAGCRLLRAHQVGRLERPRRDDDGTEAPQERLELEPRFPTRHPLRVPDRDRPVVPRPARR